MPAGTYRVNNVFLVDVDILDQHGIEPSGTLGYVLWMFAPKSTPLPPGTSATSARGYSPAEATAPLYSSMVPAGFPSPADDHLEGSLDLHDLVVRRPAASFFCRASGNSMTGAGIHDGDLLVVDRSIQPHDGDVVVATLDGGLTVKTLRQVEKIDTTDRAGDTGRTEGGGWELASANPDFPSFAINPEEGVQLWGVVTFAITSLCKR